MRRYSFESNFIGLIKKREGNIFYVSRHLQKKKTSIACYAKLTANTNTGNSRRIKKGVLFILKLILGLKNQQLQLEKHHFGHSFLKCKRGKGARGREGGGGRKNKAANYPRDI